MLTRGANLGQKNPKKKKNSNRKEYLQFEFLIETVNNLYGLGKNKILTKMWLFIIKYF